MGKRSNRERQADLWVSSRTLVEAPGHAFYDRLNAVLSEHGFDGRVEEECAQYYGGEVGRPSMAPGVYFRMLLVGYFEGIDSERGIAWRVADSLSLRKFLGYGLDEKTPDHSTVSRTRRLYSVTTHERVFSWVLGDEGLARGETIGIDATTLEANAAMRSIVRRDTGEGYEEYLGRLAEAEGEEAETPAQRARFDRKRKKKGRNKEWSSPADPDARITRMKDGRTDLAHKAEHAVDLDTGALLSVTLQGADQGDTTTIHETLDDAEISAQELGHTVRDVVADKGYHSSAVLVHLHECDVRGYLCEPDRGRRRWTDKPAGHQERVYDNRRRLRGERSARLHKKRQELAERSFAHMYETGGMRRLHLRHRSNILKRLLVQGAAFNLALYMRRLIGVGKPRQMAVSRITSLFRFSHRPWDALILVTTSISAFARSLADLRPLSTPALYHLCPRLVAPHSTTGC